MEDLMPNSGRSDVRTVRHSQMLAILLVAGCRRVLAAERDGRGRKASDLAGMSNGKYVRIGGCVIARQRPGTAKGFVFLSLEDETGVANAIILPDLFQKNRLLVTSEQFLMVEGTLQNQDNVISVKAQRVMPLSITRAETSSHDFY